MNCKNRIASIVLSVAGVLAFFELKQAHAVELPSRDRLTCDKAASIASEKTGVPLRMLQAIGRTESGTTIAGSFVPWPWTINVEGRGIRFDSLQEANNTITAYRKRGYENIDVGCFQINHRWHGDNFSSVDEMLDPVSNARYAAQFLKKLHAEYGSWIEAAAAYHSRNGTVSKKYLTRLIPILESLEPSESLVTNFAEKKRLPNTFPLLNGSSQSQSNGSLFPTTTTSRGSLLRSVEIRG